MAYITALPGAVWLSLRFPPFGNNYPEVPRQHSAGKRDRRFSYLFFELAEGSGLRLFKGCQTKYGQIGENRIFRCLVN